LILVVEEPELYQHPQQCRHWAKVLRRITTAAAADAAPDTQVIFTTHSPHFVDLSWFDQVRVVRKCAGGAGKPPIAKNRSTTLDAVAQELASATGKPTTDFTAQSARARARPVMTNLVNEGFFANVAVLVEGGTEVGVLQEVARQKGNEWDAKGIAVIDVGGKTKLSMPLVVFRKMGIPIYVAFDSDVHRQSSGDAAEQEERKARNRLLLRLMGAVGADYPVEGAHDRYAVVNAETTRHLKASLGAADYDRIAKSVATDLGYAGSNEAMKNVEAAAHFAARVYGEGKTLPLFEAIVESVTALAPDLTSAPATP
jgi:predicted ATP-dependent endonuclease of OLD family